MHPYQNDTERQTAFLHAVVGNQSLSPLCGKNQLLQDVAMQKFRNYPDLMHPVYFGPNHNIANILLHKALEAKRWIVEVERNQTTIYYKLTQEYINNEL